jgi:hypothetical protein
MQLKLVAKGRKHSAISRLGEQNEFTRFRTLPCLRVPARSEKETT